MPYEKKLVRLLNTKCQCDLGVLTLLTLGYHPAHAPDPLRLSHYAFEGDTAAQLQRYGLVVDDDEVVIEGIVSGIHQQRVFKKAREDNRRRERLDVEQLVVGELFVAGVEPQL